jgi:hypothetical protein
MVCSQLPGKTFYVLVICLHYKRDENIFNGNIYKDACKEEPRCLHVDSWRKLYFMPVTDTSLEHDPW